MEPENKIRPWQRRFRTLETHHFQVPFVQLGGRIFCHFSEGFPLCHSDPLGAFPTEEPPEPPERSLPRPSRSPRLRRLHPGSQASPGIPPRHPQDERSSFINCWYVQVEVCFKGYVGEYDIPSLEKSTF